MDQSRGQPQSALVDLGESDRTVANPAEDVRGSKVVDSGGDEVGDVDGLLIDTEEHRVRFIRIGSGGFLGIGKHKRLIPVDAVSGVDDVVHIDMTREHVAGSPEYDPETMTEPRYDDYYAYYGVTPYWTPGYLYPGYPYR